MSFNHNIPKTTDLISVSQGDLLNNFTSMQTIYNTDHYGFDPVTNLGFHKHLTLPNDALNIPAPAAGLGSEFAVTVNTQTYPFWRRDGSTQNYTMMPIKAFGSFTAAVAPVSLFTLPYGNITTIARLSAGVYKLTFIDPLPNTTYMGILTSSIFSVLGTTITAQTVNDFTITNVAGDNGSTINFIIIF
jgi:hypothetical protein